MAVLDEADLVARAAAGDQRAFADLVGPHRDRVMAVCYRITGDRGAAEDAVQATLVAAWRNVGRFEGRSAFGTWLHRIAHNAALAVVRKRVPEPVATGPVDPVTGLPDRHADATERLADVDRVNRALAKLPEDFRAALVLREVAGLGYDEIARIQGVNEGTVASRINRAKRAMAALLGGDDG